ncbi:hypothetical protein GW17_00055162 [Ensete ventricosum]|nr:hypothetical protein GW17_00055162 [Ensete ventricosum]
MMGAEGGDRRHPAVVVPPWSSPFESPAAGINYHLSAAGGEVDGGESTLPVLQRQLPFDADEAGWVEEPDSAVDVYSSDEFRMYEFKVRRCARGRSHDWTECPFVHPGEKARRRDPRKYHYSSAACPDFRKGGCKRGDACEFAHGVFECWLHPARYRTQPCKDGTTCARRVCFFAHAADQLRILSHYPPTLPAVESYDGSPLRQQQALESYISKKLMSSKTSTLMSPPVSPPMSPSRMALRRASWPVGTSLNEIVAALQQLQLTQANPAPSCWNLQLGDGPLGSPRCTAEGLNSGFCSRKDKAAVRRGLAEGEEPVERVESGRALRAKIFEKLSKECVVERAEAAPPTPAPEVVK